MEILIAFIVAIGINILMFIPAFVWKTDKLTDISYAVTFVVLAIYGLMISGATWPSIILALMVFGWAARLGSYLLIRIRKIKKDARFDDKRNNFWKFLGFWLLQGFTVWAVMFPSVLFFSNSVESLPAFAWLGLAVWVFGLLVEAIADIQKYRFINNPANKGKWIESGLWKYSRHPNYFGEITLWVGVYLFTFFSLNDWQVYAGLIGPVYIASLILFVSGVPLLEKAADKRWGADPKYQQYKQRTSSVVLWFRKSL